jgi:phosphoglycerate dehydrogenase-like enzyme
MARVVIVARPSSTLEHRIRGLRAMAGIDEVVWHDGHTEFRPGDVLAVDWFCDKDLLRSAMQVTKGWLHILSTGIDEFPVEELAASCVTCSRGISGQPIAEFIVAVMLAHEKRLRDLWRDGDVPGSLGELRGRTLGVFGLGAIGSAVVRLGLAFEMRVIGTGRAAGRPRVAGIETVDVSELIRRADHLVVAAPLTARTRRVFGSNLMASPGGHLVNVSRGGLVDTDAVLVALDDGALGHASLDVTDPEPLPAGHPLRSHPKVTLSPHLAGRVAAAEDRNWQVFEENLRRHLDGDELVGVVDVHEGY